MNDTKGKSERTGIEIAVIGMSGRFPGAKNIEDFWEKIRNGTECITFFEDEELLQAGVSEEELKNKNYIKAKGILDDVDCFDFQFFNYTPIEAKIMDPQVRIFHECIWEALENAGYNPDTYTGNIGLYCGASSNIYWQAKSLAQNSDSDVQQFSSALLVNKDFMSTQISYKLNLKGPAVSVQTACSTSLVAIHIACRALLMGECKIALAGGVSAPSPNKHGYIYHEGMVFSSDGHCRPFDKKASGLVSGEGAGVVVLKLLKNAISDGDTIHAVIKGSALNNDGSRKVGFTAPSIQGQIDVLRAAQKVARVEPESITFIETHGTGTKMGDTIEFEALRKIFGTNSRKTCYLGAIKSNIGHLDAAAGIAGLIKVIMSLKNKQIPPHANFENINPHIHIENSPFCINTKLIEWESDSYPLRAGVTSLGIGGTNAHVILEEAPDVTNNTVADSTRIITISGKRMGVLSKNAKKLLTHLRTNSGVSFSDMAFTLNVGRKHFKNRMAFVSSSTEEAAAIIEQVSEFGINEPVEGAKRPKAIIGTASDDQPQVVFMFSGQGSQYINMGKILYEKFEHFRKQMDVCFEIYQGITGINLKDIIYPNKDIGHQDLFNTSIAQPLLFSFEYSIAMLLMNYGIKPDAMIGYSFGEYVGACISGVFALEDAIKMIALRGKLMEKADKGAMLSIPLTESEILPLLNEKISLAVVNGETSIVAGSVSDIDNFEKEMKEKRYLCMRLSLTHAGHSLLMDPILDEFEKFIKSINFNNPSIPYISCISGNWISESEAVDYRYWVRQLREPVRFAQGIEQLAANARSIFIEIGPGRDLVVLLNQILGKRYEYTTMNIIRNSQKDIQDDYYMMNKIANLWVNGIDIKWQALYENEKRMRIPLPTYSFERNLLDSKKTEKFDFLRLSKMKGNDIDSISYSDRDVYYYIPTWKNSAKISGLNSGNTKHTWLLLGEKELLVSGLKNYLRMKGQTVITVKAGENFESFNDNIFSLNPGSEDDNKRLLDILESKGVVPDKIVHMWNLYDTHYELSDQRNLDTINTKGLFNLICLSKAWGMQKTRKEVEVFVITSNAQAVVGGDLKYPEKSIMIGAIKTIPLEYPEIKLKDIDIVIRENDSNEDSLIKILYDEMNAKNEDTVIAFRKNKRYIHSYEELALRGSSPKQGSFEENGVYLITGGLGGLGFEFSKYLAENYKATLILTGRTQLPSKDKWNEILGSDNSEFKEVRKKISMIQELERLGSKIIFVCGDVTEQKDMNKIVDLIMDNFRELNGVIHTSGIADGAIIQERSKELCNMVLDPKVKGSIVLFEALKNVETDFVILCSSLASISGAFGQIAYSAANAFLDALAQSILINTRVISINWDRWRNTGIAVKAETLHKQLTGKDMHDGLTGEKALAALESILMYQYPQVAVLAKPLGVSGEVDEYLGNDEDLILESIHKDELHSRPSLSSEYVEPSSEMELALAKIWSRLFGIGGIGVNDDFFELGGQSLLAIRLILELEREGVEIDRNDIYKYPTIKALSDYICMARRNGNESKFEIENIEPFNEMFYKNCFYNSAFPIVRHYGKSILPIIVNDVITYNCNNNRADIIVEYIECMDVKNLLNNQGIKTQEKEISSDIILEVINSISRRRPVIVWVDCFYESIRYDMYQKQHWPHTLLIYGYDRKNKLFNIIEHNSLNGLSYSKKTIEFIDLKNSYEGFVKNYQHDHPISYFEFWLEESESSLGEGNIQSISKDELIENFQRNKKKVYDSFEQIKLFLDEFEGIISSEELLKKNIDVLLNSLNSIINAKNIQQYVINLLYDSNSKPFNLMSELLNKWSEVRVPIAKYLYSQIYVSNSFSKLVGISKEIYELELKFYNSLL